MIEIRCRARPGRQRPIRGQLPATLYLIAAVAATGGVFVSTTAALLPAQALRRLPAAHLLAGE